MAKLLAVASTLLSALLALAGAGCAEARPPQVRDGDVIFHVSRSSQSQAIQRATGSRYSHMGVVLHRDGQPYVFEAIDPVTYTPLQRWIARGEGGHYVLKRLRTPLTAPQANQLRNAAATFRGRRYDLAFEWSDQRIYARSWSGSCTTAPWACASARCSRCAASSSTTRR